MELGRPSLVEEAYVYKSLRVDLTAIQTPFRKLSVAVPDNTIDVFGLPLRRLDVVQESGEARTRSWR